MSMDRRKFLESAAVGSLGLVGAGASPSSLSNSDEVTESADRPNIMVILADDLGFADVGCYGAEVNTPHVDRLAEEGMRFSQFYNYPRCSPTRASLLTGQYPHQVGMGDLTTSSKDAPAYQGYLNDRCVTIAEVLGEAGYHTSMVGKWHVGHKTPERWPTGRGFDRFYGEHRFVDDYFKPTHQLYLDGEPVEPQGRDWYSTDAYTDYALQFLTEAQAQGQPFFTYVAYNAPHFPLQAFQSDIDTYRGKYMDHWKDIRQQRYRRQIEEGLIDEQWALSPQTLLESDDERIERWRHVEDASADQWDLKMAAYAAQIDRMDQNIGRLLRKLETMGVADNTLVLFLSDNGSAAEDWINSQNPEGVLPGGRTCKLAAGPPWANVSVTPFRFYKQWTHEGGISTPFVARWPGEIEPGTLSHEVGHVMDILPTCLNAARVEYPDQWEGSPVRDYEGQSLMPAFDGEEWSTERMVVWEHVGNRAIRKGDWKLVASDRFTPGDWELYNMKEDRTETNNLIDKMPEKAETLKKNWNQWADRVGVVLPDEG
ncbi:arylsulfatase [Salinibacter ruber]|jgi:arylsulfatase|uniref:Arylsulfatase n=2 Tax=Salinibacter ruber TaxID=146919 RepID=A0A9X2ZLX7_9BACT|nr:arylsulfatase [Salinibacter ruber]MCS3866155.1 arylsulfatase [Salinibacter ruber]